MRKFLDQTGIKYLWRRIVDTINNSISPGGGGKFPKIRIELSGIGTHTDDYNVVDYGIYIKNYKPYIDAGYMPAFFICSSKHTNHRRYTYCKAESTISEYGDNSLYGQNYYKILIKDQLPARRSKTFRKDWRMYNNILCKINSDDGRFYIYWDYHYVCLLNPDGSSREPCYVANNTQKLAEALVPIRMYRDVIPYAIYGYPRNACGAKRLASISPANHVWCIDPWLLSSNWYDGDINFFQNKTDQELIEIMHYRGRNLCFEFKFGFVHNNLSYRKYTDSRVVNQHNPLFSSAQNYYYWQAGNNIEPFINPGLDKPSQYFINDNKSYTLTDVVSNVITFKVYIDVRYKYENNMKFTPKYSLIIEQ